MSTQLVNITFKGTVSAESATGETVTVQVTNPDGSVGASVTGATVDDGKGLPSSITYTTAPASVPVGKGAVAVASIAADSADSAATGTLTFDALNPRTITLNIS
jgi:hypothetical protein